MAQIDDLVKQIADPQLRAALEQQVAILTSRKQFGLVFQEHTPETVRLPQQRVRTGDKVQLRDTKTSATYHVISTKASLDVATIVELDESGETVAEAYDIAKTDLVVVKPFGDPVYPGLRQVGEAGTAAPGQPSHVIINGENFHALQALEYTHLGKVDLIYIDPPYNTGAADWKYNDKYIDGTDSYRHSKWLSFMAKRLTMAKRLLKSTGIIVLAIDDNEHSRLKMLADQVFGENNFLANVTWQGSTKSNSRFGGGGVDYMLIYGANRDALTEADVSWKDSKRGFDEVMAAAQNCWEKSGHDSVTATALYRDWFKTARPDVDAGTKMFNFIDEAGRLYQKVDMGNPAWRPNLQFEVLHPVTGKAVKMPKNGWQFSREVMTERIERNLIVFGDSEETTPRRKSFLDEVASQEPKMVFEKGRSAATKHIEKILGDKRFPFPKDHEVLMRWFRMIAPKDAVIVDFFAGSGTTAEAVIRLNAEDGGTRQAVLVTNNELAKKEDSALRKNGFRPGDAEYEAMGVFHHVTKPRISTVLTGLREDESRYSDGIDGQSAAFFDLTYEDENLVSLGTKFESIAPLLWMQSGAHGEIISKVSDTGFEVPVDGNYAVIFNTASAADAIDAIHDGIKKVYVVTDSENDFRAVAANLPGDLGTTAMRLYANYLRSFEINRG